MRTSWNKGKNKETDASVKKISQTFLRKRIDNFAHWRKEARKVGLIPTYHSFRRSTELAFLVGMVLGDGNIYAFPRTEGLRITLGTDKPALWRYVAKIVEKIFKKSPAISKKTSARCVTITIYQKKISERLQIPCGNRKYAYIRLPLWIREDRTLLLAYLKGLYEAEASFNIHKPTYTYKLIFYNRNVSLLDIVYTALVHFGLHPHRSKYKIQVSRREEVYLLKDLLSFRKYSKI